jgi:hypothetical protein
VREREGGRGRESEREKSAKEGKSEGEREGERDEGEHGTLLAGNCCS